MGINLNPNNACNWHCVYCQVPDLRRGSALPIDMELLETELRGFLGDVLEGDFFERQKIAPESRRIKDFAISGNGEPTSAREFDRVVALLGRIAAEHGLAGQINLVLITNGSLVQRPEVQNGLELLASLHGEAWFKLDSATASGLRRINGTPLSPDRVQSNLERIARLCPTWVQTCVFRMDGAPPSDAEQDAYIELLERVIAGGARLRGVLLYGLARPSMQPEAARLAPVDAAWMEAFAARIRRTGLPVRVTP